MSPRGVPFQFGNHFGRGRPKGSHNKSTVAAQRLLNECSGMLVRKCIADAMKGDKGSMRLCMERVLPPQKEQFVNLKLPSIITAAGVASAVDTVVQAVTHAKLTPGAGQKLSDMLEDRRRAIETQEHEARLQVLESQLGPGQSPPGDKGETK